MLRERPLFFNVAMNCKTSYRTNQIKKNQKLIDPLL